MGTFQILKVLIGSRAHGLETPESDYDYRAVYVTPTEELLRLETGKIGGYQGSEAWSETEMLDNTAYELGPFLHLAMWSNPSILEVFKAPVIDTYGVYRPGFNVSVGSELRNLFPYVWTAKRVGDAFGGYSHNQQKKFLDNKDGRRWKFAVAYVRVLLQGIQLLSTGDFTLQVTDDYEIPHPSLHLSGWKKFLEEVRDGHLTVGSVMDGALMLRELLDDLAVNGPFRAQTANLLMVNDFLLRARRDFWETREEDE